MNSTRLANATAGRALGNLMGKRLAVERDYCSTSPPHPSAWQAANVELFIRQQCDQKILPMLEQATKGECQMTPANHLPRRLSFEIGGFVSRWHKVQWRQGRFMYQTGDFGGSDAETTELMPSPDQWQAFWTEVGKANVWSWRRDYSRPVLDGTSWSLELVHGEKRIRSGGDNGYPGSVNEDYEPGCAFDIFLQSLMALTGRGWYQDADE